MASSNWEARPYGRRKSGAFKSVCLGLGLGLSLGYGILYLANLAPVRSYACAKLPAFANALSCYD